MTITVSGLGRLGKDAEIRTSQGGDTVTGFSVAMDSGFGKDKQTHWFDCAGWGKKYQGMPPNT